LKIKAKNMKNRIILWMAFAQFETKLREDLYVSKLSDTVYVVRIISHATQKNNTASVY